MADQVNITQEELRALLNGPHKFENGKYVSLVKTPQQVADEQAAFAAAAKEIKKSEEQVKKSSGQAK